MGRLKKNTEPISLGGVPPIQYKDFEGVCRPLAEWYSYMTTDQIASLPIVVINALDSLSQMVRRKV